MKRILFQQVLSIFGLLVIIVIFLACNDPLQIQEQQKVKVIITVADNTARTVLPQTSPMDIASYKLLGGRNGATETILVESFTDIETSITLDPGTWNFTLNAYNNNGGHILQGKVQNKQINLTGANQVSFSLSVINSGTGSIQITLNFPEVAGITRININGDIGSENINLVTGGNFVYARNEITVGDYFINFELYRGDVLRTVVSELVLVRSGLTSSKNIILAEEDLKPIYMTGTVTISPEVSVTIGTELTAVYSGTEQVTYQWNKDGSAITNAADIKYIPNSYGSYTVTVSALGNNSKLTSAAVVVIGGAVTVSGTTLQEKLLWLANNAESNSNYILDVSASETISYFDLSYSGKNNIIITIKSTGLQRNISLSGGDSMFTVGFGITLVLDDKINLQRSSGGGTLVSVDGTLVMNEGSAITKGGVYVSGNFIMNGGKISGNTSSNSVNNSGTYFSSSSSSWGGVYVSGNFIMNGGEISGNTASSSSSSSYTGNNVTYSVGSTSESCGGVYVVSGNFIMNGGKISSNTSSSTSYSETRLASAISTSNSCGGVYVKYGTFTMYGGIISNNTASSTSSFSYSSSLYTPTSRSYSGGGVYMNYGTFTMYGGNISGNTSSSKSSGNSSDPYSFSGGGVYMNNGTFTMYDGNISANTSSSSSSSSHLFSGGGVCMGEGNLSGGTFTKTSGTIYGYSNGDSNSNVVKNSSGNVQSDGGHAVYVAFCNPERRRRTTAGPTVNMNSAVAGTAGGWE